MVQIDLKKYFNCLVPEVFADFCAASGCVDGFDALVHHHYQSLRYFHKFLHGRVGECYELSCGMPHGDAASVLAGNTFEWLLIQSLRGLDLKLVTYLDITLLTFDHATMVRVCD